MLHPAAVLLPSSLAVAEREEASGLDVITSFVLGVDIETRISYALSPREQYSRGFHPSSVCGSLAASITAGKVIGLNERQMLNALGLAGCQASGLLAWENDRTEMSRPFQMGVAARNGVTSALLARDGFAGPEVMEGKYNIFHAFSGVSNYEELPRELGRTYQVMQLALKRYSCCAFLHPGLDALLEVMDHNDVEAEEIKRIILRFPRSGAKLIDNSELRSHNAQYILSVAALKKRVRIDDILVYQQDSPKVEEFSKRIQVQYDNDLDQYFPQKYTSVIVLETMGGETFEERVEYALGTPENPLSDKEVEMKFRDLTAVVIDERRQREIIKTIHDLERCEKITDLTTLLSFHQPYTTPSES
jgi:2-methylcitrate dehydratase PrpD